MWARIKNCERIRTPGPPCITRLYPEVYVSVYLRADVEEFGYRSFSPAAAACSPPSPLVFFFVFHRRRCFFSPSSSSSSSPSSVQRRNTRTVPQNTLPRPSDIRPSASYCRLRRCSPILLRSSPPPSPHPPPLYPRFLVAVHFVSRGQSRVFGTLNPATQDREHPREFMGVVKFWARGFRCVRTSGGWPSRACWRSGVVLLLRERWLRLVASLRRSGV